MERPEIALTAVFMRGHEGYVGFIEELPNVNCHAHSLDEARSSLRSLVAVVFEEERRDHGDAAVLAAQDWLEKHFSVASAVDEMVRRSGLAERTFKRRFTQATGLAPLAYIQQLRVADAKRRLERTRDPVDEIGWRVGYEDPAFFRRLFKRITGLSPAHYRRQFQIPAFAASRPRRSATAR